MDNFEHPVFIGGTGRCGTTVMADFIGSDDNFFLPCHENKLIVEADGLIDLCTAFTSHNDDPIRKHRALVRFFLWSERLRDLGCQNMEINKQLHEVTKLIGWQNAVDLIQREFPNEKINIHAIGDCLGKSHYDKVINNFFLSLIEKEIKAGIVDTLGLLKPFYIGITLTREEFLTRCRKFLKELYYDEGRVR